MSETIGTATIYGTYADAVLYIADRYGTRYAAWRALDAATQKQTLVNAADYLNRKAWIDTAATFDLRDAIVDADAQPLFQIAEYELAALVVQDQSTTDKADQGSNIQSAMAGGGVGVTFFNPTSTRTGSATLLPAILMDLVGAYLAASDVGGPDGGGGQSGSACNPYDSINSHDRTRPY